MELIRSQGPLCNAMEWKAFQSVYRDFHQQSKFSKYLIINLILWQFLILLTCIDLHFFFIAIPFDIFCFVLAIIIEYLNLKYDS